MTDSLKICLYGFGIRRFKHAALVVHACFGIKSVGISLFILCNGGMVILLY